MGGDKNHQIDELCSILIFYLGYFFIIIFF